MAFFVYWGERETLLNPKRKEERGKEKSLE